MTSLHDISGLMDHSMRPISGNHHNNLSTLMLPYS